MQCCTSDGVCVCVFVCVCVCVYVCVCVCVLLKIIKYTLRVERHVNEIVIKSSLWIVDRNFL